jgi:hypothetical protein
MGTAWATDATRQVNDADASVLGSRPEALYREGPGSSPQPRFVSPMVGTPGSAYNWNEERSVGVFTIDHVEKPTVN